MKLIEVIGALLIMAILLPKLADMMAMGLADTQKRQAADHLALVSRASADYVRKHQTNLSSATASSGPTLSVADLVSDGLLPAGFQDRNVWGQSYAIYIRVLPGFPWVTPVRNWPGRGLDRHRRSRWLS